MATVLPSWNDIKLVELPKKSTLQNTLILFDDKSVCFFYDTWPAAIATHWIELPKIKKVKPPKFVIRNGVKKKAAAKKK